MKNLSKAIFSVSLTVILFLITNCKSGDPVQEVDKVCGVADPINHLKWLNDEFKAFLGGPGVNGIVLHEYNGNQVLRFKIVFSALRTITNICAME